MGKTIPIGAAKPELTNPYKPGRCWTTTQDGPKNGLQFCNHIPASEYNVTRKVGNYIVGQSVKMWLCIDHALKLAQKGYEVTKVQHP